MREKWHGMGDSGGYWKTKTGYEGEHHEDLGDGRFLVYQMALDDFPDWADLDAVASATGRDAEEIREDLQSNSPSRRFGAFEDIGHYYGFENFDCDPLILTEKQLEKRLRGPTARQRYQHYSEKPGARSFRKRAEKLLERLDRGQLDRETLRNAPKPVQVLVDQMLEARGSAKVPFEARIQDEKVTLLAHREDSYEMERLVQEHFQDLANKEERTLFVTIVAPHARPWIVAVRPQ